MNKDILAGKWEEMKGRVKEQWGKLTDDELDRAEGKAEQMIGLLQQRYGYSKERAQEEYDRFMRDQETGGPPLEADPTGREWRRHPAPPPRSRQSARYCWRIASLSRNSRAVPSNRMWPFSSTYTRSASVEGESHVLLGEQDREALALEPPDLLLEVLHHQGRQALRRLVQEQQLRIAHQGARDGEHLLLAAREEAALAVHQLAQLWEESNTRSDVQPPGAEPRLATSRFSQTVRSAKMRRSSGMKPMPARAIW